MVEPLIARGWTFWGVDPAPAMIAACAGGRKVHLAVGSAERLGFSDEQFDAVICMGGTVRSHLGIVTREFRIPCLMNASIDESQIKEGDRVEVEYSAQAASLEQYHGEAEQARARIWKLG